MRAERRREGRRIRKTRRTMKRLPMGYLFVAPVGDPWPEEWVTLGAIDGGFSWPDGWIDMQPGDSILAGPIVDEAFEVTFSFPMPDDWTPDAFVSEFGTAGDPSA